MGRLCPTLARLPANRRRNGSALASVGGVDRSHEDKKESTESHNVLGAAGVVTALVLTDREASPSRRVRRLRTAAAERAHLDA
jgi:hypothetical protein